jgi:hypothetical protein
MKRLDRRAFLAGGTAAGLVAGLELPATARAQAGQDRSVEPVPEGGDSSADAVVDFRFAPVDFQSTICFPDDPDKTVLGKRGDLRYDFPADIFASVDQFGAIVEFTLAGMGQDTWRAQRMESPGLPIVHTLLERAGAEIELTAFATRRKGEGRVDNVLMEVRPKAAEAIASPLIRIRSCRNYKLGDSAGAVRSVFREAGEQAWMVCLPQTPLQSPNDVMWRVVEGGYELLLQPGAARRDQPMRVLFRFAQAGGADALDTSVAPEALLDEVRAWWRQWHAFGGDVDWSLPGTNGDFLTACARNIQQAREVKNGRLVFQVGPTVYRGMWIVDGNFLLEAARYLGYDEAADRGLLSEWEQQNSSGQIIASAGKEHWKDTAIAIFTLVRACELKQDWTLLRQLAPKAGHAVEFLIGLRDQARKGDSPNGRYGILAPGFPDGGIGGVHFEFTNTLWALAGLRALAMANEKLRLPELERATPFYGELKAAFDRAAADQIVEDPRGFRYLPMIMREDPAMRENTWDRPRPQTSQWAFSQTIFPGQVFTQDDPVVRGHIALMQACTQEDVPAETGWLRHQAVWTYNAPFVAEMYLWARRRDWARRTFIGYLNHASPLHAWREEQPLQQALLGAMWGDMPHNWASAECIRYLRHMLVLEDDQRLRLLDGLSAADLRARQPFALAVTPTRFGRVSLEMEPAGVGGWKLHFRRGAGIAPESIELRANLAPGATLRDVRGASLRKGSGGAGFVDPAAQEWTAFWSS